MKWRPLNKEKIAIYTRVSHEDQVTKMGLEYQENLCRELCEYKNYEIYDIYREEGISGVINVYDRKEMKRLLEDAKAKKIQHIMACSIDRISRRGHITMQFYETLKDLGIGFITYKERIDSSTPRGKFLLSVFAYASEMELAISKERASFGREHRKLLDGECGGGMTFGYKRIDKQLVVDSQTVPIIKSIYDAYYKKNISMNQIAKFLTEEKIPTPRGKEKWYPSTVSKILFDNYSKYTGEIINSNIHNIRWPIILEESYSVIF